MGKKHDLIMFNGKGTSSKITENGIMKMKSINFVRRKTFRRFDYFVGVTLLALIWLAPVLGEDVHVVPFENAGGVPHMPPPGPDKSNPLASDNVKEIPLSVSFSKDDYQW